MPIFVKCLTLFKLFKFSKCLLVHGEWVRSTAGNRKWKFLRNSCERFGCFSKKWKNSLLPHPWLFRYLLLKICMLSSLWRYLTPLVNSSFVFKILIMNGLLVSFSFFFQSLLPSPEHWNSLWLLTEAPFGFLNYISMECKHQRKGATNVSQQTLQEES